MNLTKHTFYAPPVFFSGERVILPEDEARHASKVLRLVVGDTVRVVDGEGRAVFVTLDRVDKRMVSGLVVAKDDSAGEPGPRVILGMALLKHAGRFETVLEKAVELGVSEIVPLTTRRTEKSAFKVSRAQAILVAAMKQSGRAVLPTLTDRTKLSSFLGAGTDGLRVLCHEQADAADGLLSVLSSRPESVHIVIGPEGGFDDAEVIHAVENGFHVVSLGPRRLRAETAAIAALSIISMAAGTPA